MKLKYKLPRGAIYAPYLLETIQNNHTLIAGSTGAGKSVLENSIIYALLCTHFPGIPKNGDGAQFVFIDPKKVELRMYKNLPHTLYYADNMESIEKALIFVRGLIDSRLQRMQKSGERKSRECEIYIFIDELVDIVESQQAKTLIRLLSDCISISRACSIFFVILTQAPNRRILRPEVVLNCNCRIALFCNYAIESRQIVGDNSAIALPEHGLAIVQKNLKRYKIKIPFYQDKEINHIIHFWEKQHRIYNYFERLINRRD